MRKTPALGLTTAAWVVMLGLCSAQTQACGYDGMVPDLVAAYPQSIDVALSVRDAYDRSVLTALQPAPNALALVRAQMLVRRFSPMVGEASHASQGSVAVLLVESGMWTRYTFTANQILAQPHVAGPQQGEPVVITSEAVVSAVLDGKLAIQRASSLGLMVVRAPAAAS